MGEGERDKDRETEEDEVIKEEIKEVKSNSEAISTLKPRHPSKIDNCFLRAPQYFFFFSHRFTKCGTHCILVAYVSFFYCHDYLEVKSHVTFIFVKPVPVYIP